MFSKLVLSLLVVGGAAFVPQRAFQAPAVRARNARVRKKEARLGTRGPILFEDGGGASRARHYNTTCMPLF